MDLESDPAFVAPWLERLRIFAGYAGWGPGQLEAEMEAAAWWALDAEEADTFSDEPAELWEEGTTSPGRPARPRLRLPGGPDAQLTVVFAGLTPAARRAAPRPVAAVEASVEGVWKDAGAGAGSGTRSK